ncbi:MAG: presenilin family intramembrane aspartyl protease [Candidatus Pacearchaeota archaeon]|jgi:presenilin-like A22 family membrane protease
MFLVTQLIGLAVIYADPFHVDQVVNGTVQQVNNPYFEAFSSNQINQESDYYSTLPVLLISFILALFIIFILTKIKSTIIMKTWFFIVVILVTSITIFAFEKLMPLQISLELALIFALLIAIPLAIYKVFKRNLIIHNLTELMIYPGIAVVFIPLLNIWTMIILLIIISVYDMWAVWHSGFMQKMAKYQMNELKIFAGFYVPYLNKKQRALVKKARQSKSNLTKPMKVNLAILGGGDVVFPIITAGVIYHLWGIIPALAVTIFATLSLLGLFMYAQKGKFYPAMPFLTAGLFIGMAIAWLLHLLGI